MDTWPTAAVYPFAPPMAGRNADPALLYAGPSLWLAYRIRPADAPGPAEAHGGAGVRGLFAVVWFSGVERHRLGPPGEARLAEHPLHGRGLEPDAFHEVLEALPDAYAPRRWVVTFRAETLEVTAGGVEVVARGVEAAGGWAALRAVVPGGV